eukprot:406968-Pyramimonas_sp.AAC.1
MAPDILQIECPFLAVEWKGPLISVAQSCRGAPKRESEREVHRNAAMTRVVNRPCQLGPSAT